MVNLLAGFLLVVCAFGNLYAMLQGGINADLLHLPMMYRDWSAGHLNWFFWSLPPSRYIFPDIPVFFSLNWLANNFLCISGPAGGVWALLLNIYLDFFLVWGLSAWALKIYAQIPFKKSLLPVLLGLTAFTLPGLFPDGARWGIFWPSYHAGVVWWSLLGYCFVGLWLKQPLWSRAVAVFIASALAGLCDPLSFTIFIVPAMLAAFLGWRPRVFWWRLGLPVAMWGAYVAGGALGDLLMPYAPLQFLHEELPPLHLVGDSLATFFGYIFSLQALAGDLICLSAVACLWMLWQKLPKISRWQAVALLALMGAPVAATLAMGRFTDVDEVRYFALGLLAATLLVIYVLCKKGPRIFVPAAFVCVACLSLLQLPLWPSWGYLTYPPLVRQLDSLKTSLGLKAGLAGYWDAKPLRYFSRAGLLISPMKDSIQFHPKVANLSWFGISYTPLPHLEYNFVLTKGQSHKLLLKTFGPPAHSYPLYLEGKKTEIWLYDYNLGTVLERDPLLWEIIIMRLRHYGYMIPPTEREEISQNLLKVIDGVSKDKEEGKALPPVFSTERFEQ